MQWTAALMIVAGVSLTGCGGSNGAPLPTPTMTATVAPAPTPTSQLELPADDPGATVLNLILACREKDGERLRSLVAGAVAEEEIQALFARGTDVQLLSQTVPPAGGDSAEVTVRLRVRRGAETDLVERTWGLNQGADGVWRFTTLPDCY